MKGTLLPASLLAFTAFSLFHVYGLSQEATKRAQRVPSVADCAIGKVLVGNLPAGDVLVRYDWAMGHAGTERSGGTITAPLSAGMRCSTLGINGYDLVRARWLYIAMHVEGRTPTTVRVTPTGVVCSADLSGDGVVNAVDLGILRTQLNMPCEKALCSGDLDGSGRVDEADADAMGQVMFGSCP